MRTYALAGEALPAEVIASRRAALAVLSRAELEARYRALPGRANTRTWLTDRALIDVIVCLEADPDRSAS